MPTATPIRKKILIVEDDKPLNESLQRKFEHLGFEVQGCFDGQQGLDLLAKEKFDGLILDLMMPVKDGFAVLAKKGTTLNAATPAYVLTTMGQDEKLELARELGAKEVFKKSEISPTQVAETIMKELAAA